MASKKLYPPVIADYVPAFTGDECIIPFSLSRFNVSADFKNLQVAVMKQENGATIINDEDDLDLGRYRQNGKIILNVPFSPASDLDNDSYKRIFTLKGSDIRGGWVPGTIYKVQIRLSAVTYSIPSGGSNDQAKQLNENASEFSEQSTICIIKATSPIGLELGYPFLKEIRPESNEINIEDIKKYQEATINFYGRIVPEDLTEKLYSYRVQLFQFIDGEETLIEDSGQLFSNKYLNTNEFQYFFKKEFKNEQRYHIVFNYKTINDYEGNQEETFDIDYTLAAAPNIQIITVDTNIHNDADHYHTVSASYDSPGSGSAGTEQEVENSSNDIGLTSLIQEEEEGRIGLKLISTDIIHSGNYIIRRTDEKSDFEDQEDIKIIPLYAGQAIEDLPVYYDYTIESGIFYKYAIQIEDYNGLRSLMRETSKPIVRDFYYSFLLGDNEQQLKLKFDNTMQSFKIQQIESKIESIGGKYPKVTRNAAVEYRTFPVAGLISFQMDDNKLFCTKQNIYGKQTSLHEEIAKPIYDTIQERDFRNKVLEFLQDGKPKLFKSPTEGNIIVRLMDVNCTPNQSLGRMIYSFNSNAVELNDRTMANYLKYGFYNIGEKETDFSVESITLGQLSMEFSPSDNIIAKIFEKYAPEVKKKQTGSYVKKIKSIFQIRVTINDLPQRIENGTGKYILGNKMQIVGLGRSNNQIIYILNGIYDFDSRIEFTSPDQGLYLINGIDFPDNATINANIDFLYKYTLEEYMGKRQINQKYKRGFGQIFSTYTPETSIYNEIYYKYYEESKDRFCNLRELTSLEIEADPGCLFLIRDETESNGQIHEVNITGVLNFSNITNIKQIMYKGKRNLITGEIDDTAIATISTTYKYLLIEGNYAPN